MSRGARRARLLASLRERREAVLGGHGGLPMATRLMVAQTIVVFAGVLTAALVATFVGPRLFHDHLVQAGHVSPGSPELGHIEQAYTSASSLALAGALIIALFAAIAVTWYLSRRMTRPLRDLAVVATRLSAGDYTARARPTSVGPELSRLTETFNEVAERLETTEDTRRRLLADLAHEMRTPLAVIAAQVDGLEDGVTTWTPETARVLRDHTDRLVRLAADISEVSRAEEGRLDLRTEPVKVTDLVWAAAQGVRAEYAVKGVNLLSGDPLDQEHADSAGVEVQVDRQRILQVLTNLLTNALRHTPVGGTVTIDAHQTSGRAVFTVSDTGEGIPPAQLPHVFERFYRGDSARDRDHGGSGIGLTIARGIARAHEGSLTAYSDGPGLGATFTLTLPLATGR